MHASLRSTPCILFALKRERLPFCHRFKPEGTLPGAPVWAQFFSGAGRTVLVLETGVGRNAVTTALDWLLRTPSLAGVPYRPTACVFAGFAGALTPEFRVGDVVLANEVVDEDCHRWPTAAGIAFPADCQNPVRRGRILTTSRLVGDPAEKRSLGATHAACAVDMESAPFAERCAAAGIPFACVRAISDELETALSPHLASMLAGGSASPWRFVKTLARHPGMLPELLRLARDTRIAAENLGAALHDLLAASAF